MKRNSRNRNRFEIKPLKITVSDAEIMADLRHGVDGQTRQLNAQPQGSVNR